MSADEHAADAENLELGTFMLVPASATFDSRDRVMSFAAWDLQHQATAYSAVHDHPGFVPDSYLDARGTPTTIAAAELCTAGMWERISGGYRVLDWVAVEACLEHADELRGKDARARARQQKRRARMATSIVAATPCALCGTPYARIEVIGPGQLPAQWNEWGTARQEVFLRLYRQRGRWHLFIDRPDDTDRDFGQPIDAVRAGQIRAALEPPLCYARIRMAGFYDDAGFCDGCDVPYCYRHWNVSSFGVGRCPRGHGKSLGVHWPAQW